MFPSHSINFAHPRAETCLPPPGSSSVNPLWRMMSKVRLLRYMILGSGDFLANAACLSARIEQAKLALSPLKSLQYGTQWRRSSWNVEQNLGARVKRQLRDPRPQGWKTISTCDGISRWVWKPSTSHILRPRLESCVPNREWERC